MSKPLSKTAKIFAALTALIWLSILLAVVVNASVCFGYRDLPVWQSHSTGFTPAIYAIKAFHAFEPISQVYDGGAVRVGIGAQDYVTVSQDGRRYASPACFLSQ